VQDDIPIENEYPMTFSEWLEVDMNQTITELKEQLHIIKKPEQRLLALYNMYRKYREEYDNE